MKDNDKIRHFPARKIKTGFLTTKINWPKLRIFKVLSM